MYILLYVHLYWPAMTKEVELFVNTCGICKQPRAYLKAPHKHVIAHNFNDVRVIVHIEPEKAQGRRTPSGNKYILSITDLWSGYVIAVPTKTQKAEETIKLIMHHWILKFGMPREILADGAPCFTSMYFATVLEAFGCKETHGIPQYRTDVQVRPKQNDPTSG